MLAKMAQPLPPPVAIATEIAGGQKREQAINSRLRALNTERDRLIEERETLRTKRLELLREFDRVAS